MASAWRDNIRLFVDNSIGFIRQCFTPHIRSRLLASLALMRGNVENRLTVAWKQYKHDYDKRLCKTPAIKTTELLFFDRPPRVGTANSSKTTNKSTFNKWMPRADGPFRKISVQQRTLTRDESGVPNIIWRDRATPAPSNSTNASLGKERNDSGGE